MGNILFFYIYANKDTAYNVVRPEDVDNHIEYNQLFRPGRLMYKEDSEKGFIRLNDGCIKEEYLKPYDEMAQKFFETNNISKAFATVPYR